MRAEVERNGAARPRSGCPHGARRPLRQRRGTARPENGPETRTGMEGRTARPGALPGHTAQAPSRRARRRDGGTPRDRACGATAGRRPGRPRKRQRREARHCPAGGVPGRCHRSHAPEGRHAPCRGQGRAPAHGRPNSRRPLPGNGLLSNVTRPAAHPCGPSRDASPGTSCRPGCHSHPHADSPSCPRGPGSPQSPRAVPRALPRPAARGRSPHRDSGTGTG